jgi:multiple sugar transport system ATP-binding protein
VKAVFDNDVAVESGSTVSIAIEPASVRLFDAETGIAIRGA